MLIFLMSIPTHAVEILPTAPDETSDVEVTLDTPSEYTDTTSQTATTFDVPNDLSSENNYADVKMFLAEVGMEQKFIDKLTEAQLERYASAINITVIDQMIPLDPIHNGGGDTTVMAGGPFFPIIHDPGGSNETYTGEFLDDWMRLYFMVIYLGDGVYLLSVDATWLDIPANLLTDSLGIATTNLLPDPDTIWGWTKFTYTGITSVATVVENEYSLSSTPSVIKRAGYGAAMLINLVGPSPTTPPYLTSLTGITAHFEYEGSVEHLALITNFKATATYDHAVKFFDVNVAFGISLGSSPSIGFNIDVTIDEDIHRREAYIPSTIRYIPD